MRKVILSLLAITTMAWFVGLPIYAAMTDSVSVSATINGTTELIMSTVFQVDSKDTPDPADDVWTDTGGKTINFGNLTHTLADGTEAGMWIARPYYYALFLTGWTFGQKYKITSTNGGLWSGADVLPKGVELTPGYNAADNGGQAIPLDATLGSAGPLETVGKTLYDSGPSAKLRTIQVYIGVPPINTDGTDPFPGHVPIPLDQKAGTYSGTVTFTLTLY